MLTLLVVLAMQSNPLSATLFAKAGKSSVYRLIDKDNGVVCYIVPQDTCIIDHCVYSPAIACIDAISGPVVQPPDGVLMPPP